MSPPLVLFHGFTGTGEAWRDVIEALPEGTEVWAPDLPGHGSQREHRPASFEATVDALAAELEARYAEPVRLAGYSMGGRLALGLALEHPERVAELVLISCHGGLVGAEAREDRAARDDALAEDLLGPAGGLEGFVDRWQALPLFASQAELPGVVLDRQRQRRLAQDPAGLAWALSCLSPGRMPDYGPRLPELRPPIRLLAGGLDTKYVASMGRMAEALGVPAPTVLPDCGHNPLLEAPTGLAAFLAAFQAMVRVDGGAGEEEL